MPGDGRVSRKRAHVLDEQPLRPKPIAITVSAAELCLLVLGGGELYPYPMAHRLELTSMTLPGILRRAFDTAMA